MQGLFLGSLDIGIYINTAGLAEIYACGDTSFGVSGHKTIN
jgi:hypothetical protein